MVHRAAGGAHRCRARSRARFDDETQQWKEVDGGDFVWAAYCGMPMGWPWALWICHETLVIMESTAAPGEGAVLDRRAPPDLSGGKAAAAPYVDNANIVGLDAERVHERLENTTDKLEDMGLKWHERCDAARLMEILGVEMRGGDGKVRHKAHQAWWLHQGIRFLLQVGHAAGWQVRVYIGHLVSDFQLMRPGLASLRALYDFVGAGPLGERRPLPPCCRNELKVIKGLLFLAEVNLRTPPASVAYMSDASTQGYFLFETT